MAPGSTCEKVQFLRKLSKGPGPHRNYGIKLAKLSALPSEITSEAEKLSAELRKKCGYSAIPQKNEREINEQNVYSLAEHLMQAVKNTAMSGEDMRNYLKHLQEECMKMNDSNAGGRTTEGSDGMTSNEVSFDSSANNQSNSSVEFQLNNDITDLRHVVGRTLLGEGLRCPRDIISSENQTDNELEESFCLTDKRRQYSVEYTTTKTSSDEMLRRSNIEDSFSKSDQYANTGHQFHEVDYSETSDEIRKNGQRFNVEYSTSNGPTLDSSEERNFQFQEPSSSGMSSDVAKFYTGLSVKRKLR